MGSAAPTLGPTEDTIARWMQFFAETGQPELCDELYHNAVPKDAKYKISQGASQPEEATQAG